MAKLESIIVKLSWNGIGNTESIKKYGIFIVTNNYRKMHGMPMRRRVKNGKSKIKN